MKLTALPTWSVPTQLSVTDVQGRDPATAAQDPSVINGLNILFLSAPVWRSLKLLEFKP